MKKLQVADQDLQSLNDFELVNTKTVSIPPKQDSPVSNKQQTSQPVPPVTPPPSLSTVDVRYTDISHELPSKFIFYNFDSLSIRTLTLGELKKIYRSHTTRSLRDLVEAIGLTIDVPAMDLTVGDFWYLMYWQRLNSYKKSPLNVNYVCDNPDHTLMVRKQQLPESSLEHSQIVSKSDLVVDIISEDDFAVIEALINQARADYNLYLFPQTMRDVVESTEMMVEEKFQTEDMWLIKLASNISRDYGKTLADRMKFLETTDQLPDLAVDIQKFQTACNHGVQEKVLVSCKECGASKDVVLSIDALTFFPDLQ